MGCWLAVRLCSSTTLPWKSCRTKSLLPHSNTLSLDCCYIIQQIYVEHFSDTIVTTAPQSGLAYFLPPCSDSAAVDFPDEGKLLCGPYCRRWWSRTARPFHRVPGEQTQNTRIRRGRIPVESELNECFRVYPRVSHHLRQPAKHVDFTLLTIYSISNCNIRRCTFLTIVC